MRVARSIYLALVLALSSQAGGLPPKVPAGMKGVEGKYHYLIHDLSPEEEQEVLLRMEAMVDEYIARTRDFSGRLNQKLPFMLFRKPADYYRNGGIEGSAGVFTGASLMAIAGEKLNNNTWHTIQHEGFHQFAAAVIGGDMPIWVNEGLAEYFGEAVYTGDGFVSGAIPRHRLKRVQGLFAKGSFKSVERMMGTTHQQWNRELNINNYDQAWTMVTFLAHGEDGKYQKAFGRFMIALNKQVPWQKAWQDSFGSAAGFETKWEAWWTSEERTASVDVYARAATQMLTSYLGRATSQKQSFDDIDKLLAAVEANEVKWHKSDALPASLGKDCVELTNALTKNGATFTLAQVPVGTSSKLTQPGVVCVLQDGSKIIGTFKLKGARMGSVLAEVEVGKDKPKPDVKPGK